LLPCSLSFCGRYQIEGRWKILLIEVREQNTRYALYVTGELIFVYILYLASKGRILLASEQQSGETLIRDGSTRGEIKLCLDTIFEEPAGLLLQSDQLINLLG